MDYGRFSDEELVAFAQQGSADAFGELTRRHLKKIFTTAFKIIENYQEAEDATQEIFTLAWSRIRLFRAEARFTTWLYRLAHNYCIDIKRAKKRRPEVEALPPEDETKNGRTRTPLEELFNKESQEKVNNILKDLTERQRKIIELRQDDLTLKQIADELGCSLATVKREIQGIKGLL
jgi:RNA polymerase sigma-70 factor (ECF subfamily)